MAYLKTFKMLTLERFSDEGFISYPLVDGIIINQENSHHTWILEVYVDREYAADFEPFIQTDEVIEVRAIISYPDNEPAGFRVVVNVIEDLGDQVSILMKGTLKTHRRQYAELLLEKLVEDGLSGDQLIEKFRSDMSTRPRIKP
ncbi:YwpF family protein [Kurthia zopfii]|uniref:YwpF family protein n=1 Tax=Kurthia zopfii TaxID=1650 RepID=UPI002F920F96